MVEQLLLNKLLARQKDYALESLLNPGQKDSFEFGQRCGYVKGLADAMNMLLRLLDDEKNGDNDL